MQIVVERLIALSEPMKEIWLDFHNEWAKDTKGIPYFILMTSFAGYMVNLYLAGEMDTLKKILAGVEGLYRSEGTEVNMLLTSGLLEDIQRFLKVEDVPLANFVPLLGDTSRERWEATRAYIEEGKSIHYE
jgi:hypothetical protein